MSLMNGRTEHDGRGASRSRGKLGVCVLTGLRPKKAALATKKGLSSFRSESRIPTLFTHRLIRTHVIIGIRTRSRFASGP
jgi:hypothetical protein